MQGSVFFFPSYPFFVDLEDIHFPIRLQQAQASSIWWGEVSVLILDVLLDCVFNDYGSW